MCKKIPKTSEWKKQKTKNNEVSWWCNTVHVKSLARIESFWVFSSGFNSLMNNISKIYLDIQTLIYIFSKQRIVSRPNERMIGYVLPGASRLQSVRVHFALVWMSGGVPDIICVAQITFKFVNHAVTIGGFFSLIWGENLAKFSCSGKQVLFWTPMLGLKFCKLFFLDLIITLRERRNVVAFFKPFKPRWSGDMLIMMDDTKPQEVTHWKIGLTIYFCN